MPAIFDEASHPRGDGGQFAAKCTREASGGMGAIAPAVLWPGQGTAAADTDEPWPGITDPGPVSWEEIPAGPCLVPGEESPVYDATRDPEAEVSALDDLSAPTRAS